MPVSRCLPCNDHHVLTHCKAPSATQSSGYLETTASSALPISEVLAKFPLPPAPPVVLPERVISETCGTLALSFASLSIGDSAIFDSFELVNSAPQRDSDQTASLDFHFGDTHSFSSGVMAEMNQSLTSSSQPSTPSSQSLEENSKYEIDWSVLNAFSSTSALIAAINGDKSDGDCTDSFMAAVNTGRLVFEEPKPRISAVPSYEEIALPRTRPHIRKAKVPLYEELVYPRTRPYPCKKSQVPMYTRLTCPRHIPGPRFWQK